MLNNGATVIPHSGVPSLPSGLTHVNAVIRLTCDKQGSSRFGAKKEKHWSHAHLDMHHL